MLIAHPLPIGERGALEAALNNANLPIEDIEASGGLFWRFETVEQVPVGFGGLELYAMDALLRSIIALPQVRGQGIGTAIVATLEWEAKSRRCSNLWLITTSAADFFDRLGYARCARAAVPSAINSTTEFSRCAPPAPRCW